jgi:2-dehydro-3-deoxygalactonokinase
MNAESARSAAAAEPATAAAAWCPQRTAGPAAPAAGIALDWGTSNLRAFLLDRDGAILAQREKPWGILSLPRPASAGGFDAALEGVAGDWMATQPQAALIASGMVGSAQGWREAPYVDCPASAADLAGRLASVATAGGRRLMLVPGILSNLPDRLPDVIRGEETQVFGALAAMPSPAEAVCFVLPGTHSKWVLVRQGRIVLFATYMTGELYASLTQHSILGRLMKQAGTQADAQGPAAPGANAVDRIDGADAVEGASEADRGSGAAAAAFLQALEMARTSGPGDLMRHLFTARSMNLAGRLPAEVLADYLSGLLIGHELVSAVAWRAREIGRDAPIVLIGEEKLLARYRAALPAFGLQAASLPNTAAAGLHHLLGLAARGPDQPDLNDAR